jgi:hypothetical protein
MPGGDSFHSYPPANTLKVAQQGVDNSPDPHVFATVEFLQLSIYPFPHGGKTSTASSLPSHQVLPAPSPIQSVVAQTVQATPTLFARDGTPALGTPTVIQVGSVPLFADPREPQAVDSYLDLDTGSRYVVEDADVQFASSHGTMTLCFLTPTNGARALFMDEHEPGCSGCQESLADFTLGNIPQLQIGSYICFLTNMGNLAQVKVDAINRLGEGSLEITFVTWSFAHGG